MTRVFITGSSGLIGSEMVRHFDALGASVVGTDTNIRADFFGPEGDTHWNLERLRGSTRAFRHFEVDIRDRDGLQRLVRREGTFDLIVRCAAQPSHDLAAGRPLDDFDVNAVGTINVLEAVRRSSPDAVFVHLSTNKVYGDAPNELPLVRAFHTIARVVLMREFRDLTNNLKLMRREVVDRLDLRQPGFAVNAETGLQPLLMGYAIKEAPIAWINRTPDMGTSSFRLLRVGGGYWQTLWHLWLRTLFGAGPYRIPVARSQNRRTWREEGGLVAGPAAERVGGRN